MVRFALPLILLSFQCACHSEEKLYTDILNRGYRILKITDNTTRVFSMIDDLWTDLFFYDGSYLFHQLNADKMRISLDTLKSMLNCSGIKSNDSNERCPLEVMKNLQMMEAAHASVVTMNKHLENINRMYRTVFTNNHVEASRPFALTDELYHFIIDGCNSPLTCIFDQITGKHLTGINIHRQRTLDGVSGELYRMYLIITFHFLKGYAADMYRNDAILNTSKSARIWELSLAKFLMHTHRLGQIVMSVIKDVPKYIVLEEPSHVPDSSESHYIQLRWYVSRIIVNEANMNSQGYCLNGCYFLPEYNQSTTPSVSSRPQDFCNGTLLNCHILDDAYLYLTDDDSRRYDGIKFRDGTTLGNIDTSNSANIGNTDTIYYTKSRGRFSCDICTCLCDDYRNPNTIRTFSLKAVTSNIQDNMVITGLQLVERDGTIYIQIHQGKVEDLSRVTNSNWVPVDVFDKATASPNDFFELRYKNQSPMLMDTISIQDEFVQDHIRTNDINHIFFPNNHYLLTGVKFAYLKGALCFGIRLSAWNAKTKKIGVRKWNNWIFHPNLTNRTHITLDAPDVSSKAIDNVEYIGEDYYVKFRPTDDVKDFGQTTVPFFDARPVVTNPPIPLSGAGLFFKGKKGYGGVIGLKLVSIDHSHLIVTELL